MKIKNKSNAGSFLIGLIFFISFNFFTQTQAQDFTLPSATSQLITGTSKGWDDSFVTLQKWEKKDSTWIKIGAAQPGRLGAKGLAWGRGLHPADLPGLAKVEGDLRAPAGVFTLGEIYSYNPQVTRSSGIKLNLVTERDLWVEDVTSPYYNQHLKLSGENPLTEWEKKQQMKQNDPAHLLKLFIDHNAGNSIQQGAGSSIFFHIWRHQGAKASHGCTVMDETALRDLIAWLKPENKPLYVLLPESVYEEKRIAWKLP